MADDNGKAYGLNTLPVVQEETNHPVEAPPPGTQLVFINGVHYD